MRRDYCRQYSRVVLRDCQGGVTHLHVIYVLGCPGLAASETLAGLSALVGTFACAASCATLAVISSAPSEWQNA